jgi:Uma2 family endonuclease
MPTATRLTLTPADHGRDIDPDDFEHSDCVGGYRSEIIDGRVYMSPLPNVPHEDLELWLLFKLVDYSRTRPDILNRVTPHARVFLPNRAAVTCPEPDIAAYEDYPFDVPRSRRNWRTMSPILVAEVVSPDTPEKDLERNVELYLDAPSIREYWILDPNLNPDAPDLRVYRRRGKSWQKPIDVPFGAVYETPRLLPGFRLVVDPDQ